MKIDLRLGKRAPRHDARTLKLARFVDTAVLPAAPAVLSYADKVKPWPMYGNDNLGDCTIAAAAHMIELWSRLRGKATDPRESTVVAAYKKLSPKDEGCVMLDVLNYWRKTGFANHKLYAFVALNLRNSEHIKLGVSLFGGVYLGVNLPTSAQAQTGPGKVWDVGSAAGGWGGHAINVVGYDATGLDVVTWGMVQRMTWGFWNMYADEAYACLTADWREPPTINGIDFAALQTELRAL